MKKTFACIGAALLTSSLSVRAAENNPTAPSATATHSVESMTSGSHAMPAQKQMHMSDKIMPSNNPKCSDEALAKMPAEHRAACGKKN